MEQYEFDFCIRKRRKIVTKFDGNLVILGFGSIGQGILPLILEKKILEIDSSRITIVTADDRGKDIAEKYNVKFINTPIRKDNYRNILSPLLKGGDFLLNVSVDVSSTDLIIMCRELGVLYLDTCIEPWPGGYTDKSLPPSERSNYAMRERALKLKVDTPSPTAVLTHGANPGLVSHFVKQALINIQSDICRENGSLFSEPRSREEWARFAENLDVRVIHIAERDTQVSNIPKRVNEFVNTWSIDGFVSEGGQPAELGWGTHETFKRYGETIFMPEDGRGHEYGCNSAIYLMRPGASTRVRSWTPLEGPYHGFLITHGESISIADYYTVKNINNHARYRPTVHYAYHPCDDAVLSIHELTGKNWNLQDHKRLMMDEIVSGMDELGVLLAGHKKGAYWYGSRLTIDEARQLVPYNNATSLQVTIAALAGMVWAIENPECGIVEPDEMDYKRILEICNPYLGEVVGVYTDWTPAQDREKLFPEDIVRTDPWVFENVRVR